MQTDGNTEQPLPSYLVSPRPLDRGIVMEEQSQTLDPSNIMVKDETEEDLTSTS